MLPHPTIFKIADTADMRMTLVYFKYSRPLTLDKQLGRLTLAEAAETMDSINAVKTVCLHVFAEHNVRVPEHYTRRLDGLTLKLSMAKARDILIAWRRFTYGVPDGHLPTLTMLDLFLTSNQMKGLTE